MENWTSNTQCKKVKCWENLEMGLVYEKCKYHNNAETKIISKSRVPGKSSKIVKNLLPEARFGYIAPRDIPARYFNQKLLNFNKHFASDANDLFFCQVYIGAAPLTFINKVCYAQN